MAEERDLLEGDFTASASAAVPPFVDGYIGYRQRGAQPGIHRGLPSGSLTFIVSVGAPIEVVAHPDRTRGPSLHRTTFAGLHTEPALIRHDGNQEGVAISLNPVATRALLGMPAGALADVSVEFEQIVGPIGRELWERVQSAKDFRSRFAVCDEVLSRISALRGNDGLRRELRGAWYELARSGGTSSVERLADLTGWSRQHLARRFRSEFGLTPKRAARVLRFERSRDLLRTGHTAWSLAGIAAECGYYDQAHLTNEWASLAGCSPREWCATEQVPLLQDEAPKAVGGIGVNSRCRRC